MEKSTSVPLDCSKKCRHIESECESAGRYRTDQCQNLYNQCVQKCAFA